MKSKKEEIMNKIMDRGGPYISLPYNFAQEHGTVMHSLMMSIQYAVQQHVRDIAKIIVDDIYTNEEFEQDIGLTK
jgi:hypothetical protein